MSNYDARGRIKAIRNRLQGNYSMIAAEYSESGADYLALKRKSRAASGQRG